MKSTLQDGQAVYSIQLGKQELNINDLLGEHLHIKYMDKINCIACGKTTGKSFGQGFCYQCFTTAPEADECILRPDRCRAHLGISRDMRWAEGHCLQPHIVYMAVSGGLKVGVTRPSQVPVRWIDQGATRAVKICQTPNRHIAGVIETFLTPFFGDKTNWKRMVTNKELPDIDIISRKREAVDLLPVELKKYVPDDDDEIFKIHYPVIEWPRNPVQINLDKTPSVEGKLTGVRGQYLFFDNQKIFNIRRFSGYLVEIKLS